MTDPLAETKVHISTVRTYLRYVAGLLQIRGELHDASKLQEPEAAGYAEMPRAFQGKPYGTPEYMAVIEMFRPVVEHHYANNSHHPEHWPNGVSDMSLLDVIEMLCDWYVASKRKGADFEESIQKSVERFGIDPQLASILKNTAKELVF